MQVEPITKGHHIRLIYSLTAEAPIRIPHWVVENPVIALTTANSSPLYAALKAALENPAFLPAGAVAATPCMHGAFHVVCKVCSQVLINATIDPAKMACMGCAAHIGHAGGTLGIACSQRYYQSLMDKDIRSLTQDMLKSE